MKRFMTIIRLLEHQKYLKKKGRILSFFKENLPEFIVISGFLTGLLLLIEHLSFLLIIIFGFLFPLDQTQFVPVIHEKIIWTFPLLLIFLLRRLVQGTRIQGIKSNIILLASDAIINSGEYFGGALFIVIVCLKSMPLPFFFVFVMILIGGWVVNKFRHRLKVQEFPKMLMISVLMLVIAEILLGLTFLQSFFSILLILYYSCVYHLSSKKIKILSRNIWTKTLLSSPISALGMPLSIFIHLLITSSWMGFSYPYLLIVIGEVSLVLFLQLMLEIKLPQLYNIDWYSSSIGFLGKNKFLNLFNNLEKRRVGALVKTAVPFLFILIVNKINPSYFILLLLLVMFFISTIRIFTFQIIRDEDLGNIRRISNDSLGLVTMLGIGVYLSIQIIGSFYFKFFNISIKPWLILMSSFIVIFLLIALRRMLLNDLVEKYYG